MRNVFVDDYVSFLLRQPQSNWLSFFSADIVARWPPSSTDDSIPETAGRFRKPVRTVIDIFIVSTV